MADDKTKLPDFASGPKGKPAADTKVTVTALSDWSGPTYVNDRHETLPVGVVFVPRAGSELVNESLDEQARRLGGTPVAVGVGGFYMYVPQGSAYWETHDAKTQIKAGAQPTDPNARYQPHQPIAFGGVEGNPGDDLASLTQPNVQQDPLGVSQPVKAGKTPGTVQVTDAHGNTVERAPMTLPERRLIQEKGAQSTFSALGLPSSINGDQQFLLSQGPNGLAPTGIDPWTLNSRGDQGSTQTANQQDLIAGPRGLTQNQPMYSAQVADTPQYMTVRDGLQWFAQQAVQNPELYANLVVALNRAGYFTSQYSTSGPNYLGSNQLTQYTSGFSMPAGEAFVRAAVDNSIAQSTGDRSDLLTWLQHRSQGYTDFVNSGAGYVPDARAYQDPATLELAAKSAAQAALGRNLTPAEDAAFTAHYRALENAAYDQRDAGARAKQVAQFTGNTAGVGGGSYTAPDTTGEADQYINNNPQFAQEKAGYQGLSLAKGLIDFIKGGGL